MQWRNLNVASLTMCWSQHLCFFLDVWVGPIVRERRFWVVTRVSCRSEIDPVMGQSSALRQREPLPSTWCSWFDWCWHPMRVRYYTPYTAKHNWMSCTFHITWALKLFQTRRVLWPRRLSCLLFGKYDIVFHPRFIKYLSARSLPNRPMKERDIPVSSLPKRGHNDLYVSRLFKNSRCMVSIFYRNDDCVQHEIHALSMKWEDSVRKKIVLVVP